MSELDAALLATNISFNAAYANPTTPLWATAAASASIPPDIQVSSIVVGIPDGFEGGITLDAPAVLTTPAAAIRFNRTDEFPSPNDYSRLAMTLTKGSGLYPPVTPDEKNVALTNNFGTFYDTFATGDLLVYGLVNPTTSQAGPIARLTQNLSADPNLPELNIEARAVHISSLIVSSINGVFPGGGGGYNPNLELSTLTMNQGGNITLQTSTSTGVLKQYSTTSDLYISSSGVVIDNLKVSSINGQPPGAGGGYNPNLQLSTLTMNNGGNITLQVSSGTSVFRQWENTSDIELTGSGLHLSTLYVSSISNYVFNVSTIQSDNISSIAGQFGEATVGQLSSFVSNTVKQIVSSVSFTASLGGVNLGGVDLGLGGFLGGLTGQLVTGATSVTLSGIALATGATALALTRVSSNVYLPGQNSNGFNLVNGQTQLQFSTFGTAISTFTRYTSSIAGSDPSVNPQPEFIVFSTIPAGTPCIRSFSDPINPINPSTFRSTLQSFGQWVAVPPPAVATFSTVTGDFVVGSNLRVGGNISTPSISTTSLRVASNAQIVGALTTGTLTSGNSLIGSVVFPGGGVINATSVTGNVAGITNITATNLTVANINGQAYPPVVPQFSTTVGNFVVPAPYNLIAPNISTTNLNAFGNILTPSISTNNILALGNITTPSITTTDITAAGVVRAASISTGSISTGTLRATTISTNSISTNSISTNVISASNLNTTTINGLPYPPAQSQFSTTVGNFVVPAPNNLFAPSISTVNVSTTNLRATNVDTTTINGLPYPPAQTQFSTTVGNFVVPAPNNLIAPNISTTNLRATGTLETGALVATNGSIGGVTLGPAGSINGGAISGTSISGATVAASNISATNLNTTTINNAAYPPVIAQFSTTTGNFRVPDPYNFIAPNISTTNIQLDGFGRIVGYRIEMINGNINSLVSNFFTADGGITSIRNGTFNANDNCITNLSTVNIYGNVNSSKTITASTFTGSNLTITGTTTFNSFKSPTASISTITDISTINGVAYPPPAVNVPSTFSTFTISSLTTNNIRSIANISTGGTLFASNAIVVGQVRGFGISSLGAITALTSIDAGTTITAGGTVRGANLATIGSITAASAAITNAITAGNGSIGGTTLNPGGNVNCVNLTVSGALSFSGSFTVGGLLTVNSNIVVPTGSVSARQLISDTDVIGATLNISNNALSINQTGTILTAAGNYTTTNGTITATNGDITAPNGNITAASFNTAGTLTASNALFSSITTYAINADSFNTLGPISAASLTTLVNITSIDGNISAAAGRGTFSNLTITRDAGVGRNFSATFGLTTLSTVNARSANISTIGASNITVTGNGFVSILSATNETVLNLNTAANPAPNTQQQIGSLTSFAPNRATTYGSGNFAMIRAVGITYNSGRYTIPSIANSASALILPLQFYYLTPARVTLYMVTTDTDATVVGLYNLLCYRQQDGFVRVQQVAVYTIGLSMPNLFLGAPPQATIGTSEVQNTSGTTITNLKCSWTYYPLDT